MSAYEDILRILEGQEIEEIWNPLNEHYMV
jgi:hypothetical protein